MRLSSLPLSTHLHRSLATKVRDATPRGNPVHNAGRPRFPKDQFKNVVAIRLSESKRRMYEERARSKVKLSAWIR